MVFRPTVASAITWDKDILMIWRQLCFKVRLVVNSAMTGGFRLQHSLEIRKVGTHRLLGRILLPAEASAFVSFGFPLADSGLCS